LLISAALLLCVIFICGVDPIIARQSCRVPPVKQSVRLGYICIIDVN